MEGTRDRAATPHVWESPDGGAKVTWAPGILESIRANVMDAFMALPRRGAEAGGLLLGRIEDTAPLRARIDGFQPIACEHRFGPSFLLSESDHARAAEMVRGTPGMVGLYRSYTGREAVPDSADQELIEAYSARSARFLLLLQPLSAERCMAAVAWDERGVRRISESFAFSAAAMPVAASSTPDAPPAPRILPPPAHPRTAPADEPERPRRPRFWAPLAACIGLSVGAAAAYEWWIGRTPAPPQTPPAGTQLTDRQDPLPAPAPPLPAPPVRPPEALPETPPPPVVARRPAAKPPEAAVPPQLVHQVQPGVPEGIRARIEDRLIVPVKVRVSASGRVVDARAEPGSPGLYSYLAGYAVRAARQSRFLPARTRNGAPAEGERTIYFHFTR